ncbi:14-3-3 protein, partial [Rhizodiscina lignyota]
MASSDVDQKYLAQQAQFTSHSSPLMSSSLFQILGLSVMLARKLVRARRLRRLDTSRDTKSLQLYHHIIWLSREGLAILQTFVLPYTQEGQHGPELQVLAAKLQASFFHVFCLFHNNPPITQTSIPSATIPPVPLSPRAGNGQTRRDRTPPDASTQRKPPTLRDPVPSYTSEASYLTNPYASVPPGTAISPPSGTIHSPSSTRRSPAAPPGLAPIRQPTPSSSFIFPAQNFLPATSSYFNLATSLAAQLLPGSHPLRLSVAIEHAAFLWDCVRDGDGSRAMARRAIRDCHAAKEGLSDADFEDAAECVGVLGRMMRREGLSGSPSFG